MTLTRTRVLLSFTSAYSLEARQLADELRSANLSVQFDPWRDGGCLPATQVIAQDLAAVDFVLPLLSPSTSTHTWIGEAWKQNIYDSARTQGIDILPVRLDLCEIPDYLSVLSFADRYNRDPTLELRRLLETIRRQSGDATIVLPSIQADSTEQRSTQRMLEPTVALEVHQGLMPLFANRNFLTEQVPMMRDGLFYELGVPFPQLRLRVGADLPPATARLLINDMPEAEVRVPADGVMVHASVASLAAQGITAEPIEGLMDGLIGAWIPMDQVGAAETAGFYTKNFHDGMIFWLAARLRHKADSFIGVPVVMRMLAQLEAVFPHLVAETVPKVVPVFVLTDVLRRLVIEQVCIRDLRRILMALADWGRTVQDPLMLTEYVRATLNRAITHQLSRGTNELVVFLLDPKIEASIRRATKHTATGTYVDIEDQQLQALLAAIRTSLKLLPEYVQTPQILTVMDIRSSVRRLIAPSMPELHVTTYPELRPDVNIQPIGRIELEHFSPRQGVKVKDTPLWANKT